jgi:hypothetical protein
MVDPRTPASTKVRAAESVLNHSEKAIGLEDIEERLAELERGAELSKNSQNRFCMTNFRKRLNTLEARHTDPSGCALYSPGWYKYRTARIHRVFIAKTEPAEAGCLTIEAFREILVRRAESGPSGPAQTR